MIEHVRAWLLAKNPRLDPAGLTAHTDLIDSRVVDSLCLVELILFLEESTGRPILVEALDPSTLRTIAKIVDHYFSAEAP